MNSFSRTLQQIKHNDIASSPFAKFDNRGNLSCIVCKVRIKNKLHWNSHLHGKEHKSAAFRLKEYLVKDPKDVTSVKSFVRKTKSTDDSKISVINLDVHQKLNASNLPEGFFDNPVVDAKVRKVDYKNKIDAEYELFQKSIAQDVLKAELVEEKEDVTREKDRLINEADELIQRWSHIEKLYNTMEMLQKTLSLPQSLPPHSPSTSSTLLLEGKQIGNCIEDDKVISYISGHCKTENNNSDDSNKDDDNVNFKAEQFRQYQNNKKIDYDQAIMEEEDDEQSILLDWRNKEG